MIVAISGTPATGKTPVARALAKLLGWKLIGLNQLAEDRDLYSGYDEKRRCKIVDIDALADEVKKIDEDAVLESHYAHDMPCDVIIILRCNPAELRRRMEEKGWSKEKIEENLEAEIMGVCSEEARDSGRPVLEIDTTKKRPDAIAKEIQLSLKRLDLI